MNIGWIRPAVESSFEIIKQMDYPAGIGSATGSAPVTDLRFISPNSPFLPAFSIAEPSPKLPDSRLSRDWDVVHAGGSTEN